MSAIGFVTKKRKKITKPKYVTVISPYTASHE